MNIVMKRGARLIALAALLGMAGCSGDETSGEVTVEADTGDSNGSGDAGSEDTSEGTSCGSSDECDDAAEGNLCTDGLCAACAEDEDCEEDYGDGATCDDDGMCVEAECAAGTAGCPCDAGACEAGLSCSADGVCVAEGCVEGTEGCACAAGDMCEAGLVCTDGECAPMANPCEAMPGTQGCPCEDGACAGDLVCMDDTCQACPPSMAGCPCVMSACDGVLVCDAGACRAAVACADAGCAEFQTCTEAPGADAVCEEACEDGYAWTGDGCEAVASCNEAAPGSIAAECAAANRTCVTGEGAEGAECGACLEGFLDDGGTCRAALGCDDLSCAADNRVCVPGGVGSDASCGGCVMGFLEEGGVCVADLASNCSDDPNDSNSILTQCMDQMRSCLEGGDGAICGDCIEGFVEEPNSGECRSLDTFIDCDSNDECPGDLECIVLEPATASRCLPLPCDEGETWDLRDQECTGRCNCDGVGLTGRVWPVTDWNGDCVCETEPGFFFNTSIGSRQAEPCDADGDGWTRRSAFEHVTDADAAVRLNARCDVRSIDRVTLVNEYGQSLDVTIQELSNGLSAREELYETDESDDEDETMERQGVAYGARRFHAAEVNPMTKACVSVLSDLNDNGVSDLREHHRDAPSGSQRSWMATFVGTSYFVELHTGRYEPPAEGDAHGRYVIAERSRCDAAFALGYDDADGSYWSSCGRRRDGGYDPSEPLGYDFQRWSCDSAQGDCPPLMPPTAVDLGGEVPPHGLCEDRPGVDPEAWRGMNHASQFKCVEIVADAMQDVEPFQVRRATVRNNGASAGIHQLNACSLEACGDDAGCAEFDAPEGGANPSQPRLTCASESSEVASDPAALLGRVGLVSVRFQDYIHASSYAGGCIDEAVEWPQLCPGFDPQAPFSTISEGNNRNFGKLMCGCGFNYGGPECDLGCPSEQLHFGGTNPDSAGFCADGYCVAVADEGGEEGGRSGYWMCGDFTATAYTEVVNEEVGAAFHAEGSLQVGGQTESGSITLRGAMPTFGTDGTPMCQNADEGGGCTGFVVR